MANSSSSKGCNCPVECDAIKYSYYFVSTPFNPEEICPKNLGATDFLMKDYYQNMFPPKKSTVCQTHVFGYICVNGMIDHLNITKNINTILI